MPKITQSSDYFKPCPMCGRIMYYASSPSLKTSVKLNRYCTTCCRAGKKQSPEHVLNRVQARAGYLHANDTKKKMSDSARFRKIPKEQQSTMHLGLRGVKLSPIRREQISECVKKAWANPVNRKKYYDALSKTKWLKVRTDRGQLELLEKWNKLGFQFEPNYQIHTNGFLFYIDGYDKEHGVVLEYDSKYHHKHYQREKDLLRQKRIIDILNPKRFWRYDSVNKCFKNILEEGHHV